MRLRHLLVALLALACAAAPAAAQQQGAVELGLFGRASLFDQNTRINDGLGAGGRLGWFFARNFELEGTFSFTRVEAFDGTDVDVTPLHARVIWNLPLYNGGTMLLGGGWAHNIFGGDADASDDGPGALLGFRIKTNERLSFRREGTADYYGDPDPAMVDPNPDNAVHYGVQAGVSWLFGTGPGDKDGDGVKDDVDRCPGTPKGDQVDAYGCSLPKDSDGDGVTDDKDQCPNTPKGDKVDSKGCSLPKDSDGDGVTDDKDACPNTPKGEKVDAKGCPLPKVFEEGKTQLILEGVYFETNKADLKPESKEVLDRVAASLKANPDVKVEVQGHTDSSGSRALNVRLSQARAESVRNYLIGQGVAAGQLTAKGYGPDKPIADNGTAEGRAKNRRVELAEI